MSEHPAVESSAEQVEASWWTVDHFDSDRSYHLYCPICYAQIPGFLVRYASRAPESGSPCEGCGVGGESVA